MKIPVNEVVINTMLQPCIMGSKLKKEACAFRTTKGNLLIYTEKSNNAQVVKTELNGVKETD